MAVGSAPRLKEERPEAAELLLIQVLALASHLVQLRQVTLAPGRVAQVQVEFQELVELLQLVVLPAQLRFASLKPLCKRCDFKMTRSIRNETSTSLN